jgi:hypothetical protein
LAPFGIVSDRFSSNWDSTAPGPGHYEPVKMHNTPGGAISLAAAKGDRFSTTFPPRSGPAPGHYSPAKFSHAPRLSSMFTSTSDRMIFVARSSSPPPGSYEPVAKPWNTGVTFTKESRDTQLGAGSQVAVSPGPGTYESVKGANMVRNQSPPPFNVKETRFNENKHATPGPARYNTTTPMHSRSHNKFLKGRE